MARDGGGGSAAGGCGVACVERDGERHTAEVDALAGDVAVVQDERDLWIGGELRESTGFLGGRNGQRGEPEVSEMMQGAGSDGAAERVGVPWDDVVAIDDEQMAGDRLRDGQRDWRLRLRRLRLGKGNLGADYNLECQQDKAAKHGRAVLAAVAARLCIGELERMSESCPEPGQDSERVRSDVNCPGD